MTTILTEVPQRLLRTPSPYADESLAGYLLRLAQSNYYQTPTWILNLAKNQGRQIHFPLNSNKPIKLSQLIQVDEELLKSIAFGAITKDNIVKYSVYQGATRLCSDCLKKSLYSRLIWDSPMSGICPIHRCHLLDLCPECQQPIKWSRPSVAQCQCGFDFRNAVCAAATDSRVNFSLYLYGHFGQVEYLNAIKEIYRPDNPVFHLTLSQFSRLSRFLGVYVRVYWRYQRCSTLSQSVFTEFDSELEELSKNELVFDFFHDWKNNLKKLLRWHESNLQQRSNQSKTVSTMVDFLVKLSSYFPVHCSISIWLESYLINFLSRNDIDQTEIIWTNPTKNRSSSFKLKEVQYWLPRMAQTWNNIELSIARLIIASQFVSYFFPSELHPIGVMILRNPELQILRLKLNLCFY